MAAKVNLEMSVKCFKKLSEFLDGHEYEIAVGQDAYGELRELFVVVFDTEPTEDS